MEVNGEAVSLDGGASGYLYPCGDRGAAPAVVLLPAIAGVNTYIRERAAAIAAQGHNVFLLDYYGRTGDVPDLTSPAKIGAAVQALSDIQTLEDIGQAVSYLNGLDCVKTGSIGTLGYCIGGMYSYMAACKGFGIKAAIDYYGTIRYRETSRGKPEDPFELVEQLDAPLLAHFGDYDRLISAEDINSFRDRLRSAQQAFEMYVYSGAPHAFDEDFRPEIYRPTASAEAWRRSMVFLDWHLKSKAIR